MDRWVRSVGEGHAHAAHPPLPTPLLPLSPRAALTSCPSVGRRRKSRGSTSSSAADPDKWAATLNSYRAALGDGGGEVPHETLEALERVLRQTAIADGDREALARLDQRGQRDLWLDARMALPVTASEAAAVLGVSPHASVTALYDRAENGKAKQFVNQAMVRGTAFEQRAIDDFSHAQGVEVQPLGLCVHPEHTWLGGSPDGRVKGEKGTLVEIKVPNRWSDSTSIPDHYLLQMLLQMECVAADKVPPPKEHVHVPPY